MNRILLITLAFSASTLAMENHFDSHDHVETQRRSKRLKSTIGQTAPQGAVQAVLPSPVQSLPRPNNAHFPRILFLEQDKALPEELNGYYDRHSGNPHIETLPERESFFAETAFDIHFPKNKAIAIDDLLILGTCLPKTRLLHLSAQQFLGNAKILKGRKVQDFLTTVKAHFPNLCTIGLGPLRSDDAAIFQSQAEAIQWEIQFSWEPFKSF